MKAAATTLLDILRGPKVFIIPTFQRRYTWKKLQWSQLWNDIVAEAKDPHPEDPDSPSGHFLGSVVLQPAPGMASTLMRHQVIDGQQRLTTLLILLAALRDKRKQLEPEWDPNSIDDQFLQNKYNKDFPERLVPTKLDREAYINTIRRNNPTGDIGVAYNYFCDSITELHGEGEVSLDELETTILLRLIVVEINTKPGDSINSIFNTLNSKGMDLSPADLVRNEILHQIGNDHSEDAYDRYWVPMEQSLVKVDNKNPDREFVTFLWSRQVARDPKTTRDDLFSVFERRLRGDLEGMTGPQRSKEALRQLRDMYEDHLLFRIIRNPENSKPVPGISDDLLAVVSMLKEWKSDPVTPITLWVLKNAKAGNIEQSDAARSLHILLSYLVKRILHGIPTNQLNRLMTPVAAELEGAKDESSSSQTIRTILSKPGYYWPTDKQVLGTVASNPIYTSARRYVKFLLSVAEKNLPGLERASLDKVQIDHVMPQRLSDAWRDYLDSGGIDIDEAEVLTHTLGNLTLTENNQKMGNADFIDKRDNFYKDSALRLNRELSNLSDFYPDSIEHRSINLALAILSEFSDSPERAESKESTGSDESSVTERFVSLLQSLPVGHWVTIEDLTVFLGIKRSRLKDIISMLDPTLARLVRETDGSIPGFIPSVLAAKIEEQDKAQGDLTNVLEADELGKIALDFESSEDDANDIDDSV